MVGGEGDMWIRVIFLSMFMVSVAEAAEAAELDVPLADAGLESRARALMMDLRCLVCQNQSIDASDAPLAQDLRRLVRTQIAAGRSDAAIMAYIGERYGDFVFLRPPLGLHTLLLWFLPLLVFILGCLLVWRRVRGRI